MTATHSHKLTLILQTLINSSGRSFLPARRSHLELAVSQMHLMPLHVHVFGRAIALVSAEPRGCSFPARHASTWTLAVTTLTYAGFQVTLVIVFASVFSLAYTAVRRARFVLISIMPVQVFYHGECGTASSGRALHFWRCS